MPLLYLMYQHHFEIIQLASRYVLHRDEFQNHLESLKTVMLGVQHRVQDLKGKYVPNLGMFWTDTHVSRRHFRTEES